MDHPGVEALLCQQDGGAQVCPRVQAWGLAVRVLRVSQERRHGLESRAEMGRQRG